MGKVKKTLLVMLNLMLITSVMGHKTTNISADEGEFSISSPEATVYTSDIRADERRQLINENWKFNLGDQSNAQLSAYDDSKWDDVQLPHDYSLIQDYTTAGEAESGYKLGGIGWYRKPFTLNAAAEGKRVIVEFGGVYMNASVYINGHKLGEHPNGYTSFAYDLTDYIDYDGENLLAVKVDHKFPSSRWYSGSGIYRNVHLTVTDDVHVDHYGVQITTPELETQVGGDVDVLVNTNIKNESTETVSAIVKQSIRLKGSEDVVASKSSVAFDVTSKETVTSNDTLVINNPKLWSISSPNLYEVVTEVLIDDAVVDKVITDYGFRTFEFDNNTGFYLNGEAVKLKGVSMHSDQGSLGTAAHYRAMERQVEILQDMGVNAIRVTHNPAADEFIEIANRKGILVIDEAFDTWVGSKNGNYNDYAGWFKKLVGDNPLLGSNSEMTWAEFDIKTMVRRGINAPSIISWSIGNEVMEGNSGPYTEYPNIAEQLVEWVSEEDLSRPSTIGENKLKANWGEAIGIGKKLAEKDGPVGFNYANGNQFDDFHKRFPDWKMYGAETASAINSRGVYNPDKYDRHLTSYDESHVGWGKDASDSWYDIITRDFMAGEFVWTGFDYLGEPTPWNNVGSGATGQWPSPKSSYFGIVDTAGLPKDTFYFYQSQWNDEVNTLHLLPAWKEDMIKVSKEGNVQVDVYSDASKVELMFKDTEGNERSLGTKEFTKHTTPAGHSYQTYEGADKKNQNFRNLYLTWSVPYVDGTVYAKAYDADGTLITDTEGRSSVTTFDKATTMDLEADRSTITADGRDLSYVTIDVTDKNGDIVEDALNLINVSVSGDGELIALDNGDQVDHEPYSSGKRKAFNGKLVAIVKSTKEAGSIKVTAESQGLTTQSTTITTTPDTNVSSEKHVVSYTLPRNYYVKLGYQPNLVDTTTVRFNDGTEETLPIVWNADESMFTETGSQAVSGLVEKYDLRVSTNVTVIESVGALLNYSVVTATGSKNVNLPSSRPIVLENGEVLDTEFPVEWAAQDETNYAEEGLVTIAGQATVFGETFDVTASVRVSDAEVTLGANVAGNNLTLTQSIPKDLQSDSLKAIVDGDRGFKTVDSGPNNSVWTNYDMAQTGDNKAEIIFTYATAQFLGEADLFFYQDSWAARLPENVELFWSNEGTEDAVWSPIEFTETIGETPTQRPSVTKANYAFDGVSAVGFKIVLTSNTGQNSAGKKLAVGLSEVELHTVNSSLVINKESTLDNILLNGEAVLPSELASKVINTEYQKAEVEAITDKNVAVTILKPYEDVIHVITESEDHALREVYTINLDQENQSGNLPADDDSLDYSYDKTTATAGAFQPNNATEGNPAFAVDNKMNTIFHSPWAGTDKGNLWLTLELEEATKLDSLRYLSRSGSSNGIVKEYTVEGSMDNETWEEISVGQWENKQNTWSIAKFDEPQVLKYVRLTAKSSYGDQPNKFMTAKEVRVRMTVEKDSIEDADVVVDESEFIYDGTTKTPQVTVTLNSKVLEQGIDYRLSYEDNIEVGQAKVVVTGIVKYSGVIEKTFEIISSYDPVQALLEATQAVELAEQSILQDDLDAALLLVNALEDSIDKTNLIERLTMVQLEIDRKEAILAVEKAEESKLQAHIDEARTLVFKAFEDDKVALDKYIARLDKIEADNSMEALRKAAVEAVEKAEESNLQIDVDAAILLVDKLENSSTKTGLKERLAVVQANIDLLVLEAKAVKAVEVAETSKSQEDVDAAQGHVDALKDSNLKTDLNARLATVQAHINRVILEKNAVAAVKLAEGNKSQEDLDAAQLLVDALENSEVKTELNARLEAVQDYLDQIALEAEAITAVKLAEISKSQEDLDAAQLLVDALENSKVKTELNTRLEAVQDYLDQIALETQAIQAVEKAESSKLKSDIDAARTLVTLAFENQSDALADYLSRLDSVEAELLSDAVKAAEKAIKALPKPSKITFDDKEAIEAARSLVDKVKELNAEQLIKNEDLLIAIEKAFAELIPLTPLEPSTPVEEENNGGSDDSSNDSTNVDKDDKNESDKLPSTGMGNKFLMMNALLVGAGIALKTLKKRKED